MTSSFVALHGTFTAGFTSRLLRVHVYTIGILVEYAQSFNAFNVVGCLAGRELQKAHTHYSSV